MTPVVAPGLPRLRLVVAGEERESADQEVLYAVTGQPLVVVHQAPPLLAYRLVARLRSDGNRVPATHPRPSVVARAGELFRTGTLAGETPADYCRRHALATGLPVAVAERALSAMPGWTAALAEIVAAERATTTIPPVAGVAGCVYRVRRAGTLGVIAPSNHPETMTAWLHAYAHGYSIALRPGQRDPLTPNRMVRALLEAGGPPESLLLLPGPHQTGRTLVDAADLGLVYGDESTVAAYAARADVAVRGPGRTKVLLTSEPDPAALDYLVAAVVADGGVRCTNVSTIYTAGDPGALADSLAARLATVPARAPDDPGAVLPVRRDVDARQIRQAVAALGGTDHSTTQPPGRDVTTLPTGGSVLHPVVLSVTQPDHPATRQEMPFPFVVVAPWRPEHGIGPLRDSLVAVLLDDDSLVGAALAEPSIRKVVTGPVPPWWSRPGVPHDGDLSWFLLDAKAELRGA